MMIGIRQNVLRGVVMSNIYYLYPNRKDIARNELDPLVEQLQRIAEKYHDYSCLPDIIRKCLEDALGDQKQRSQL
jgi:hypothetical protein